MRGLAGALLGTTTRQIVMLSVAALIAVSTAGLALVDAQSTTPPNTNIHVYYVPKNQGLYFDIVDDKKFGSIGSVTLYDYNDLTNSAKKVTLTGFQYSESRDSAAVSVPTSYHQKIHDIQNLKVFLDHGWASYKSSGIIKGGNNWVSVLTPRVTDVSYQDKDVGETVATISASEHVYNYINKDRACIIDKQTQEVVECAHAASYAANVTATAEFYNHFPPPASAQLVVNHGFFYGEHGWNMYAYAKDITYTGDPAPGVSSVAHSDEGDSESFIITATENLMDANAAKICIFNNSTQALIECAYTTSVSSTTVTATFHNNSPQGSPSGIAAKLVVDVGAIQDSESETWNTDKYSFNIKYFGTPSKDIPLEEE